VETLGWVKWEAGIEEEEEAIEAVVMLATEVGVAQDSTDSGGAEACAAETPHS